MLVGRAQSLVVACFLIALTGLHAEEKVQSVSANFDGNDSSGWAKLLLKHRNVSLTKDGGKNGSAAIRVAYVGAEVGSERVVVRLPLGFSVTQASLSFDVKFDKDFQWVNGGKLHGLGPKKPVTGGKETRPDGWSARVMYRKMGRCATYLYDQHKKKKYGIGGTTKEPVLVAGIWHSIKLEVSLNEVEKKNGWASIWIDGKRVLDTQGVGFRGVGTQDALIQQFLFSTFHGGHAPAWAPKDKNGKFTTVYATFDNFQVIAGVGKRK